MSNPFKTQIEILRAIHFTEGDKTISNDAAIRVLEAAGKVGKIASASYLEVATPPHWHSDKAHVDIRDLLRALPDAIGTTEGEKR